MSLPPEAPLNQAKTLDQALAEAFLKADHLEAPLDQRLKLYLGESRKLLPEMEATYDQLVARITAYLSESNQVPEVGEVLPAFCLTDSEGKLVELAALLENGPLVVSFNRGPWCDCAARASSARQRLSRHRCGWRRRRLHRAGTAKYARNLRQRAASLPRADRHGSRLCPESGA
jgi:hypothetical protein